MNFKGLCLYSPYKPFFSSVFESFFFEHSVLRLFPSIVALILKVNNHSIPICLYTHTEELATDLFVHFLFHYSRKHSMYHQCFKLLSVETMKSELKKLLKPILAFKGHPKNLFKYILNKFNKPTQWAQFGSAYFRFHGYDKKLHSAQFKCKKLLLSLLDLC